METEQKVALIVSAGAVAAFTASFFVIRALNKSPVFAAVSDHSPDLLAQWERDQLTPE